MSEHDKKIRNDALEEAAHIIQTKDFWQYIKSENFNPAQTLDEAAQAIRDLKEV